MVNLQTIDPPLAVRKEGALNPQNLRLQLPQGVVQRTAHHFGDVVGAAGARRLAAAWHSESPSRDTTQFRRVLLNQISQEPCEQADVLKLTLAKSGCDMHVISKKIRSPPPMAVGPPPVSFVWCSLAFNSQLAGGWQQIIVTSIPWMDEIHFPPCNVTTVETCPFVACHLPGSQIRHQVSERYEMDFDPKVCWYVPGNRIIPGFLRWCEMDFVQYGSMA